MIKRMDRAGIEKEYIRQDSETYSGKENGVEKAGTVEPREGAWHLPFFHAKK